MAWTENKGVGTFNQTSNQSGTLHQKLSDIREGLGVQEIFDWIRLSAVGNGSAGWQTSGLVGRECVTLDGGATPETDGAIVRFHLGKRIEDFRDVEIDFKIDPTATLIELTDIGATWPIYVGSGETITDGYFSPYPVLMVTDPADGTNHWIVGQVQAVNTGLSGIWTKWRKSKASGVATEALWHDDAWTVDADAPATWPAGWSTLEFFQRTYANHIVRQVQVELGEFATISEQQKVYVGAVSVNGQVKPMHHALDNFYIDVATNLSAASAQQSTGDMVIMSGLGLNFSYINANTSKVTANQSANSLQLSTTSQVITYNLSATYLGVITNQSANSNQMSTFSLAMATNFSAMDLDIDRNWSSIVFIESTTSYIQSRSVLIQSTGALNQSQIAANSSAIAVQQSAGDLATLSNQSAIYLQTSTILQANILNSSATSLQLSTTSQVVTYNLSATYLELVTNHSAIYLQGSTTLQGLIFNSSATSLQLSTTSQVVTYNLSASYLGVVTNQSALSNQFSTGGLAYGTNFSAVYVDVGTNFSSQYINLSTIRNEVNVNFSTVATQYSSIFIQTSTILQVGILNSSATSLQLSTTSQTVTYNLSATYLELVTNQSAIATQLSTMYINISTARNEANVNFSVAGVNFSLALVNLSEIGRNRFGGIVLSSPVYQWCPGSSQGVNVNTNATTAGWGEWATIIASGDVGGTQYFVGAMLGQAPANEIATVQFASGNRSINTAMDEAMRWKSSSADSEIHYILVPRMLNLATYGNEIVARAQATTQVSYDVKVRVKLVTGILV